MRFLDIFKSNPTAEPATPNPLLVLFKTMLSLVNWKQLTITALGAMAFVAAFSAALMASWNLGPGAMMGKHMTFMNALGTSVVTGLLGKAWIEFHAEK